MSSFTCLSCHVAFRDGDTQREHFRSDWHRYNLKRKMGELPPVSAETFREKVLASRAQVEESQKHVSGYCDACKKPFGSQKSYDNHMKSKKHLEMALQQAEGPSEISLNKRNKAQALAQEAVEEDSEDEMEVEEVDDDEWEGVPIPMTNCLFCSHHSASLEKNIRHMGLQHTFFIPDIEYCHDVEGLVTYLGEKVGCGFECLWCSEKGKRLLSLDAVQKHMHDKGHCKMQLEGEGLLEYSDFYDYTSSYPDGDGEQNPDEEVDQNWLSSDAFELRLPSGTVIGHRSLQRYYKQKMNPNHKAVALRLPGGGGSHSTTFQNIMNQYRALGWNQESQADSARRARDLRYMRHIETKEYLSIGTKANKLQKNFRPQVNF